MTSQTTHPPTIAGIPPGTWHVAPDASTARFTVRDKVVGTVHGTLPIRLGTVTLATSGRLREARVELDASAIDTGNARRDRDLAKPRLLHTATHPFVVVTAGPSTPGPHGWDLAATLSARGASCPLTLRADPVTEEAAGLRVHVHGRLDRQCLRMTVPTFIIGRYVDIDVDLLLAARP
jgi:polyisoprenoid-binding protein YceI